MDGDFIQDVAVDANGTVFAGGYSYVRSADTTAVLTVIRYGEESAVGEAPHAEQPDRFELVSAWPNPFNSTLHIEYELSQPAPVSVRLYDVTGREVAVLTGGARAAGSYRLAWNAEGLASGTYLLALRSCDRVQTRRVTLLK
jgi:hypothetical protein